MFWHLKLCKVISTFVSSINLKVAYIYLWFRMYLEFDLVVTEANLLLFCFIHKVALTREYNFLGYSAKGKATPEPSKLWWGGLIITTYYQS